VNRGWPATSARDYVSKPVTATALSDALKRVIAWTHTVKPIRGFLPLARCTRRQAG
jgi:hypothetical protein